MFTGIIEELGNVKSMFTGNTVSRLEIEGRKVLTDIRQGDSIAVNGVCLTVTQFSATTMVADVMNETLKYSNLGKLRCGDVVNLERAMRADGRFGGHMVSGHVDAVGEIATIKRDGIATVYTFKTPEKLMRYIVKKGSIAIDGISLTVTHTTSSHFSVSIIPHTLSQTTLSYKQIGETVNLEADMVGKYIEHFLFRQKDNVLTQAFLMEHGF
ncbi:riboflavin synthase [Fusibacter ferrireducens]|uniref:Riboflavin synthase n=1 Tax=Fusibacter ferrireducens TaxID=2785058 RepID=A0ABR9ZYK5_9FIRM|nr:riboflavin synthase [Fusibacter ferrireducens]MBF4694965.1 riboflavin synthase [Fusibacter ferrireducens]